MDQLKTLFWKRDVEISFSSMDLYTQSSLLSSAYHYQQIASWLTFGDSAKRVIYLPRGKFSGYLILIFTKTLKPKFVMAYGSLL